MMVILVVLHGSVFEQRSKDLASLGPPSSQCGEQAGGGQEWDLGGWLGAAEMPMMVLDLGITEEVVKGGG